MFELLFAFLLLFVILKVTLSLGIGLIKIIFGLVGFVIMLAILPLSFALLLPVAFVFLIGAGLIAVLRAIIH